MKSDVKEQARILEISVQGYERLEDKTQEACMIAGRRAREAACRRLAEELMEFCEVNMRAKPKGVEYSVKITIMQGRRK